MGNKYYLQTYTIHYLFQRRRRRIDRTMIGEPMNFVHTGHIGSGDVQMGNNQLVQLQTQMKSKGGYEQALPHNHMLTVVPVQRSQVCVYTSFGWAVKFGSFVIIELLQFFAGCFLLYLFFSSLVYLIMFQKCCSAFNASDLELKVIFWII